MRRIAVNVIDDRKVIRVFNPCRSDQTVNKERLLLSILRQPHTQMPVRMDRRPECLPTTAINRPRNPDRDDLFASGDCAKVADFVEPFVPNNRFELFHRCIIAHGVTT